MDELELMAGRPVPQDDPPLEGELKELFDSRPYAGQSGHCELDLEKLFKLGPLGLAAEMREKKRLFDGVPEKDALESFALALEGLSGMIRNAGLSVKRALKTAKPENLDFLNAALESCERIAERPPERFIDALHLIWFSTMGVSYAREAGLVVPGHLDRTLRPFYEKEIAAGTLDRRNALLLLENLYIDINDFVADGLAVSVMVGGRDENGEDLTNELSYLCLEALRRSKLCYPTVGVCWHEGTPKELTALAVELISKGYSTPAFFGDETIQRGLMRYGVPKAEACAYINSTCVEITPVGSSNVWVASPYFSLCSILLEEIAAQCASGKPVAAFDAFLDAYFKRLSEKIRDGVKRLNEVRKLRADFDAKPLQSALTRDCAARAKDINQGGALYNWAECSFVGIANLADALMVMKRTVFEGGMSMVELKKLLDSNFEGAENTRRKFLSAYPKYGTGDAETDALAGMIVERATAECGKWKILPDDAHFIPGAFCWVMHERLGRDCGATPDGRPAGVPFADGAGPAQGRESKGPTASVLSTSSWDHTPMMGGTALNMKFNSSSSRGARAATA
jgi:formate C-acetyltransferase